LSEGSDPVFVGFDGPVAVISLHRPSVLNAIDRLAAAALLACVETVERRPEARAVVIRGGGRAFCAGGDVDTMRGDGREQAVAATIRPFHEAVRRLHKLPLPSVAALHGAVAGAGLSLALACDFAVASEDARFAFAFAEVGASPDGSITWTLPRAVGLRKAKEIAMLGGGFDAAQAERLGLVNRVVPLDRLTEEVMTLAKRLAAGPTAAYGRIKGLMNASFDARLADQLQAEEEAVMGTLRTADLAEGIRSFLDKRPPVFRGR
jgi:2-(1,2-epoxy-1,2-dihydrophenyl)acetyl-CoA isomerase